MSRFRIQDELQSFRFWLIDVYPSPKNPFFALGGAFSAYKSITLPELSIETEDIKQLNALYPEHVYLGASNSNVVLTRGARLIDGTFAEWIYNSLNGVDISRRNFLLIQYTGAELLDAGAMGIPAPEGSDSLYAPGRLWLLGGCQPVRYKPGTDLDSGSGDVSLMELEMTVHTVDEIVLDYSSFGSILNTVLNIAG